jgi:hypothetical protein
MDVGSVRAAIQAAGDALLAVPNPRDPDAYPVTRAGVEHLRADFATWITEHRRPAIFALVAARETLGARPKRPALVAVTVTCPDGVPLTATPTWDPHARAYYPRRPSVEVVRQVVEALAAAPVRPADLEAGLIGAIPCSRSSARRAIRDSLRAQAITTAEQNHLFATPSPRAGLVPGRAAAGA